VALRSIYCNGRDEEAGTMRPFLFGMTVGALVMYVHLEGFGPVVRYVRGWWYQVSAPRAEALQQ